MEAELPIVRRGLPDPSCARPWLAPATPAEVWGPALARAFHAAARLPHLSRRTETCYRGWVRRFFAAQRWRHPSALGRTEVTGFLSDLAVPT
jgi:hypothetical protein